MPGFLAVTNMPQESSHPPPKSNRKLAGLKRLFLQFANGIERAVEDSDHSNRLGGRVVND
jgi:hypothetical protein